MTADMVELTEFPHLAQRYYVRGGPRTMSNAAQGIDGSMPEGAFVDMVVAAATPAQES